MAGRGALDFPFAENLRQKCSGALATFKAAVFSFQNENFGWVFDLDHSRGCCEFGGQQAPRSQLGKMVDGEAARR